ncbi:MAG: ABC transporter ATP-binding protein [Rhodocyclaceae bacterium]
MTALLEVKNLNVHIPVPGGSLHAVRDVSLAVAPGRTLCVVGESGCGKSMTMLSIIGLLPPQARMQADMLRFGELHLDRLTAGQLADVRGLRIGMIFQDPLTAFNPTMTIGRQLEEVHLRHLHGGRRVAREKALQLLARVGITSPESRLAQYPHELSGGLRQRAMIAMALMCDPVLLLADEPTTALDVTIQAQVLRLLKSLQASLGIATIFITHDLGVVAAMADDIAVMYAGQVVETGSVREVFARPRHPYTQALFSCVPRVDTGGQALGTIPGRVPALTSRIEGCAFRERCTQAQAGCASGAIALRPTSGGGSSRCLLDPLPQGEAHAH